MTPTRRSSSPSSTAAPTASAEGDRHQPPGRGAHLHPQRRRHARPPTARSPSLRPDGGFGVGLQPQPALRRRPSRTAASTCRRIGASPAGPPTFDKNVAPGGPRRQPDHQDRKSPTRLGLAVARPAGERVRRTARSSSSPTWSTSRSSGDQQRRLRGRARRRRDAAHGLRRHRRHRSSLGSTPEQPDRPGRQRHHRQLLQPDRRRRHATRAQCLRQLLGQPAARRRRPRQPVAHRRGRLGARADDRAPERASSAAVTSSSPAAAAGATARWSSCGSCHPDGLTDNITWIFARRPAPDDLDGRHLLARPRHAEAAHLQLDRHLRRDARLRAQHPRRLGRPGRDHHRADPGRLRQPRARDPGRRWRRGRRGSRRASAAGEGARRRHRRIKCAPEDWDDIDNYAQTIRPARRPLRPDARRGGGRARRRCCSASTARLRQVPRRRRLDGVAPLLHAVDGDQRPTLDTARRSPSPRAWPADLDLPEHVARSRRSRITAETAPVQRDADRRLPQVACAMRNVGTFGIPGDAAATDALEVKAGAPVRRAQGRGGYNVPSLYGLAGRRAATCTTARPRASRSCSPTRSGSATRSAGNANFLARRHRRGGSRAT